MSLQIGLFSLLAISEIVIISHRESVSFTTLYTAYVVDVTFALYLVSRHYIICLTHMRVVLEVIQYPVTLLSGVRQDSNL